VRGRDFRVYWTWAGGLLLVLWTASVAAGLLLGPVLPSLPHLALVGTALFVAMLVPKLSGRVTVAGAAAAAGIALVVVRFVPELGILAGTLAGVAVAMTVEGRTS
jgi:predicted branched-subunit amino acid permease